MEFAGTACWVGKRCKESRAIAAKVVGRGPGHKGPSEEHRSRAADQRQAAQEPRLPRSSGGSGGMLFSEFCLGRPMHRAEWYSSDLMHPIFGTCFFASLFFGRPMRRAE